MPQHLTELTIGEMSLVDRPANSEYVDGVKIPRAVVSLWKRDDSDLRDKIAKILVPPSPVGANGQPIAQSFNEVYAQVEAMEEFAGMGEEFQERVNALCQSVYSILADTAVTDKQARINEAVDQFVAVMRLGLREEDEAWHQDLNKLDEAQLLEIHKAVEGQMVDGKPFPASDFAYVPDKDHPSTWKLRLTRTPGGDPDSGIVGAAVAALGPGFRGKKVQIPASALASVKAKVRAAWRKANPDKDSDQLPEVLKRGELMLTPEELVKKIEAQEAELAKFATLQADADVLKTENAALKAASEAVLKMTKKEAKAFGTMTEEQKKKFLAGDEKCKKEMVAACDTKKDDGGDDGDEEDMADMKKIEKLEADHKTAIEQANARVAKAEAEQAATNARLAATEQSLAAIAKRERLQHFTQVAEQQLPYTSGSPVEKGEMLMTLADSLPGGENGDVFKRYLASLAAADTKQAVHFGEVGKAGSDSIPAEHAFQARVTEIAKRDKVSEEIAVGKAMDESPELYYEYKKARGI